MAVINTKDNKQSTPVYSDLVAVRYTSAAATPTPTATPAQESATPNPSATPEPGSDSNRYSLTSSLIFFAVMGVLAIAAMVVIIIYIKRSGKDEDEDE